MQSESLGNVIGVNKQTDESMHSMHCTKFRNDLQFLILVKRRGERERKEEREKEKKREKKKS